MTSARRVTARDQLPRTDTRCTQTVHTETEAGTAEGIRYTAPRESELIKLLLPELLRPGKAQNAGPTESVLCGVPKNWNRTQLRAGSL